MKKPVAVFSLEMSGEPADSLCARRRAWTSTNSGPDI